MDSVVPVQLQRLIKKADSSAVKADKVVREAIRSIRAELALLAKESDIATSAVAREKAYDTIRKRMAKLAKRLDDLLNANLKYAGKQAAFRAAEETGVRVRYSKRYADEVVALISDEQGENLAAVFTEKMGKTIIGKLRMAVVSAFRESAVAGGTMKDLARIIDEKWQKAAKNGETFVFTDAGGHVWNTKTYMTMNTRTNAMRVYNDCLVENMARATGSDLVRVSYGGDPHCGECFPWEGRILSASGDTEGFPSYDDAKAAGCFHPNCVHTLEAVDELIDRDEIELQRRHNMENPNPEDMMEDRTRLDTRRKVEQMGMGENEARIAVLREYLTDAIRNGLIVDHAEEAVAGLTDEQVDALCPGGKVPEFTPAKGTKKKPDPERWNRGKQGGVVHIKRDGFSAERLIEVAGL